MKKLGYAIAALGVIAIAAPSIASAQSMEIRQGGDREHHGFDRDRDHDRSGARAEFREHRERGYHEGWCGRYMIGAWYFRCRPRTVMTHGGNTRVKAA